MKSAARDRGRIYVKILGSGFGRRLGDVSVKAGRKTEQPR